VFGKEGTFLDRERRVTVRKADEMSNAGEEGKSVH